MGGFCGLGYAPVQTTYQIPKVTFQPGEEVDIALNCDNSATRLSVKSFKVKLFRRIETSVDHPGVKNNFPVKNIYQFDSKNGRFQGCPARQQYQTTIRFRIPETETDRKTPLCGSINTKFLKVAYELRCYVKHNGIFQKGQGNCITFPIVLVERPHDLTSQKL